MMTSAHHRRLQQHRGVAELSNDALMMKESRQAGWNCLGFYALIFQCLLSSAGSEAQGRGGTGALRSG
eukprot:3154271-Amphidinium_carterae.1